jgi:hypothetical protein
LKKTLKHVLDCEISCSQNLHTLHVTFVVASWRYGVTKTKQPVQLAVQNGNVPTKALLAWNTVSTRTNAEE